MTYPAAVRRRGLIILLVVNFLMWFGFSLVIPLISLHYVGGLGFAAATVGAALALRQLVQQGASLVGGVLGDRLGARELIFAGVVLRVVGLLFLAYADTPTKLYVAMLLSALGGALFEAPMKAAMTALTSEDERARFYSLLGVSSGLGMTGGPFIGAFLLSFSFTVVSLISAACFALIALVTLLLPRVTTAVEGQRLTYGLQLVFRDRTFLLFTLFLMGHWYMWVQLNISLPLVGQRFADAADAVRLIYGLNAVMTVLFQVPLISLVEKHFAPLTLLVGGIAIMALGIGLVAFTGSLVGLVLCVVIFTIGTLLANPTQQSVAAGLADQRALGSYFAINSLAVAIGGGLGNYSGGWLVDLSSRLQQPALPWLVFAVIGGSSMVGMLWLSLRLRRDRQYDRLTFAPRQQPSLVAGGD
jgi:DHA1 family multidrug resistance protein-like MFS transporter